MFDQLLFFFLNLDIYMKKPFGFFWKSERLFLLILRAKV